MGKYRPGRFRDPPAVIIQVDYVVVISKDGDCPEKPQSRVGLTTPLADSVRWKPTREGGTRYSSVRRLLSMPMTADPLPFGPTGPFLLTDDRLEALSRLLFTAEQRRPLAAISGPAGVGKSRLLKEFARQLRQAGRLVREISLTGITRAEFPRSCLAAGGADHHADATWSALEDFVLGHGLAGDGGVWLFDELDGTSELGPSLQRLQRRLHATEVRGTMVIVADHARALGPLRELVDWPIVLRPWSPTDATTALEVCERNAALPTFAPEAVERIVTASGGQPAGILRRCEAALLAASLHAAKVIDGELVDEAQQQLFAGRDEIEFATVAPLS